MRMTRQHFKFIASLLADIAQRANLNEEQYIKMIEVAVEWLRQTNKWFCEEKFVTYITSLYYPHK